MEPEKTEVDNTNEAAPKSIVPSKYSGKYKGEKDAFSKFVDEQTKGEDGKLNVDKLFDLARANGVADDKLQRYIDANAANVHGAPGRSRMSVGNMLRSIAKKEGSLNTIDGQAHPIQINEVPTPTEAQVDEAAGEEEGTH